MKWPYLEQREQLKAAEKLDLDAIARSFVRWSQYPERSVLYNTKTGELLSVQSKKLGNQKYAAEIAAKVSEAADCIATFPLDVEGKDANHKGTVGLFLTLTLPPQELTVSQSWTIISAALNNFKAALSRIFGVRYVGHSVKEAHESGYVHVHIFMILDSPVDVHLHRSKKNGFYTDKYFWRLNNLDLVNRVKLAWSRAVRRQILKLSGRKLRRSEQVPRDYAFCDIQGVVSSDITGDDGKRSNVMYYLLKYMAKPLKKNIKSILTLALAKLFGTRNQFSKAFLVAIGSQKPIRHDILTNELKQLETEYDDHRDSQGSLRWRNSYLYRLSCYHWFISKGLIPFHAVQERIIRQHPFDWYRKWWPSSDEIYAAEHPENSWKFVIPTRFSSAEDAKQQDCAFRKYIGDIAPERLHPERRRLHGSVKEIIRDIILLEGLQDLSPDYHLVFC